MNRINKILNYYNWGGRFLNDPFHIEAKKINELEVLKKPFRHELINYLIKSLNRDIIYLEIGVRNPADNFDKILAKEKYSVDPGIEFKENPVDFPLTSDVFFEHLRNSQILNKEIRFDVIFIDGLHFAEQVDRDICNALDFIKEDGFIVLHDCNPPTESHAREEYNYELSPAYNKWNGTTWKAFYKCRTIDNTTSCCINSDFGIGIITKLNLFNRLKKLDNPYFEYNEFNKNRIEHLNLISFDDLKQIINGSFNNNRSI